MLHIKLKGKKNRLTKKKNYIDIHTFLTLGQFERSDIEIVQKCILFIELSTNVVDRLLIMICVIPKLNLGVREMRWFVIYTFL